MSKIINICIVIFFLTFSACTSQYKKVFFFGEPTPPQISTPAVNQKFFDHPPLYIPKENRKTITFFSPYFTLAIPNAMDMTGRSGDLQRSLADILSTQIFKYPGKRRINLLDRGALINLDPEIIMHSLNQKPSSGALHKTIKNGTEELKEYLKNADGILLTYITSRKGTTDGYFRVDYRIVLNEGKYKKIVLLAGTQRIRYYSNSSSEIEYSRYDVRQIAKNIFDKMTLKYYKTRKAKELIEMDIRVVKCDPPYIVLDIGKDEHLMPGMTGYVVERDQSVSSYSSKTNSHQARDFHYSYISEFIVTDVFPSTSNALIIKPDPEENWEVRSGDLIRIK